MMLRARRYLLIIFIFGMFGCNLLDDLIATPTLEEETSATWETIIPGVEYQSRRIQPRNSPDFDMHIIRLDPNAVYFRVHYTPGESRSFAAWQIALPDSLAFINGSFFTPEAYALGLTVADGMIYGASYEGFGGMFQVDLNGMARVRSLVAEPYTGEQFLQAMQAYPMMVEPSGVSASTGAGFEQVARRTIVAQDKTGHILLMTTGLLGEISFYDLQEWLLESSLDIDVAFTLDGGRSTSMYLNRFDKGPVEIAGFSDVPIVLAVYRR